MEGESGIGHGSGGEQMVAELAAAVEAELAEVARADPLAALSEAARLERLARTLAEHAAGAAAGAGMSWSDIGAAYGISRQAAHQRFARHVRRRSKARPRNAPRRRPQEIDAAVVIAGSGPAGLMAAGEPRLPGVRVAVLARTAPRQLPMPAASTPAPSGKSNPVTLPTTRRMNAVQADQASPPAHTL